MYVKVLSLQWSFVDSIHKKKQHRVFMVYISVFKMWPLEPTASALSDNLIRNANYRVLPQTYSITLQSWDTDLVFQ